MNLKTLKQKLNNENEEGETPRILWMFGAYRPMEDFLNQNY